MPTDCLEALASTGSPGWAPRRSYILMTSDTVRNPSVPLLAISVSPPVGVPFGASRIGTPPSAGSLSKSSLYEVLNASPSLSAIEKDEVQSRRRSSVFARLSSATMVDLNSVDSFKARRSSMVARIPPNPSD